MDLRMELITTCRPGEDNTREPANSSNGTGEQRKVMMPLTGDPRDEPQGPQDSKCSEGFHVKPAFLFHWRLHTADVIDEVHHNSEQPERHHTVSVCNCVGFFCPYSGSVCVCVCVCVSVLPHCHNDKI